MCWSDRWLGVFLIQLLIYFYAVTSSFSVTVFNKIIIIMEILTPMILVIKFIRLWSFINSVILLLIIKVNFLGSILRFRHFTKSICFDVIVTLPKFRRGNPSLFH